MNHNLSDWKKISSRVCCENEWIRVREDTVQMPLGSILNSYIVIEYCGAVAIWLMNDDQEVLMVEQYRYPISEVTLEIPSGALSGTSKEEIKQSAKRELREETGYVVGNVRLLTDFHPSPGSSDEIIYIVEADDIETVQETIESRDMFIQRWIHVDVLLQKIRIGEITHGPTLVAALNWMMRQGTQS